MRKRAVVNTRFDQSDVDSADVGLLPCMKLGRPALRRRSFLDEVGRLADTVTLLDRSRRLG
jgi:hypothetical protein